MYYKICNVEDYAVYAKDLKPHMTVIGFWKSRTVKVIVLVTEYDAVDKQKLLESFGSADFYYESVSVLDVDSDTAEKYEREKALKDMIW